MEVIIKKDADTASEYASRILQQQIESKSDSTLGLATGSTPLRLYKKLIKLHEQENLNFGRIKTFNLDEYVGLDPEHPSSYHFFMKNNLFDLIDISKENIHLPDGKTSNIPEYCQWYEEQIKAAGGIDLQLLGIGSDGHIGFNEPSSSLSSRTRIKTLTQKTISDNAPFFNAESEIPHHVITMGIGTIMESKTCLLLAFGNKKAQAVKYTVEGPITAMVPASVLQMHPDARIILDEEAASQLERTDYYNWVFENKPDWQRG